MNKKVKILILSFLCLFLTGSFLFTSLKAAAYYQPDNYRRSLLDIREAERLIRSVDKNLKKAKNKFKIIASEKIEVKLKEINNSYQKMIAAYQQGNDSKLQEYGAEINLKAENLSLEIKESKPVQMRGLWLDSGTFSKTGGRTGLKKLLDLAQKANFNLILPESYYKGLSVIPSNKLFKQDPRFKDWKEDPLKVLIEEAHQRKMEVHPWVWVFNENTKGEKGRILKKHPEWAAKNKAGEIISYHNSSWLSPARREVRNYLQQRYQYLVKNYDLDGINLDYIRFPEEYRGSFGYDQETVKKFKDKYNLDPFQLENSGPKAALWNQFRESLITRMVRESSQSLRKIKPELLISADVIPGRKEARYRVLQDWSLWLKKDYLDFVLPMTYSENLFSEISDWIKKDREVLNKPLYAGISVFKLSSEQLLEQIALVNEINPNGMALFAAAHLKEKDYQQLSRGVFAKQAQLPHQNKEKSLELIRKFILERLNIIKKRAQIKNHELIRIRVFLDRKIKEENSILLTEFIKKEKLQLTENVIEVLVKDFNYLDNIIRLY